MPVRIHFAQRAEGALARFRERCLALAEADGAPPPTPLPDGGPGTSYLMGCSPAAKPPAKEDRQ